MRTPRRTHFAARALGLALVTAVLSVVAPAMPSYAAGCQSELAVELPPSACDDVTPPETSLEPLSPTPNAQGWTRTKDVTLTFAVVSTDPDDADEMKLECKLAGPSQANADWADCESPKTYTDLADTPDGQQYTFTVRAYDATDRNIDYDDPMTPFTNEDEVADEDATPESLSWKQDTDPPAASIFPVNREVSPYDEDGTGWPIATRTQVTYELTADEDNVTYRCQLDGVTVPCHQGENTFSGIKGGEHILSLGVRDQAGNEDASPATKQFVMPYNLTSARGWKKVSGSGYFAGDVLQTKKYGATVKFPGRNVEQVRLMAPANAKLGKIQVRLDDWKWKTYDLSKGTRAKVRFIDLRGPNPPLFSGPIQIRNISRGKLVQVDALVFPHG